VRCDIGKLFEAPVGLLQFDQREPHHVLGFTTAGDIDDEGENVQTGRRRNRRQSDFDGKFLAAPPHCPEIAPDPHEPLARARDKGIAQLGVLCLKGAGYQRLDQRADEFAARVAKHAFALGVHLLDAAVRPDQNHRSRTGFDGKLENVVQRIFSALQELQNIQNV
jgi:hypothetical protein